MKNLLLLLILAPAILCAAYNGGGAKSRNFYHLLDVHPKADPLLIKKAFEKARRHFLPSSNNSFGDWVLWDHVEFAGRILLDPESRAIYDGFLERPTDGRNRGRITHTAERHRALIEYILSELSVSPEPSRHKLLLSDIRFLAETSGILKPDYEQKVATKDRLFSFIKRNRLHRPLSKERYRAMELQVESSIARRDAFAKELKTATDPQRQEFLLLNSIREDEFLTNALPWIRLGFELYSTPAPKDCSGFTLLNAG